jgi:hypothetical protein
MESPEPVCNRLISVPALRKFHERHFHISRGSTHRLTYLKISKQGGLLWAIGEPLMIGQHLVMWGGKSLPVVIVRIIIKLIFAIVLCSLIFVCNLIVHFANVSGLSLYYLCPFFVWIILILAKQVVVIAQLLELQHVCLE